MSRAASSAKKRRGAVAQVEKNGGITISGDGIQPEKKGSKTASLVRAALTGYAGGQQRDLLADGSDETLLAPVVDCGVNMPGTLTDARARELLAVEELSPGGPWIDVGECGSERFACREVALT